MSEHTESIVLGGGCFWCLEASFQLIKGVESVEPGYAGGSADDAYYLRVCSGSTGHAEVVRVMFDTQVLQLQDVLDIFWAIHNPTTLNRQGADEGTQYRSVIFYNSDAQRHLAEQSRDRVQALWDDPIVTDIQPLTEFFMAEAEHHNYFKTHPDQAYCQIVINPKLRKLRQNFASRLRA